jgi:hypothetical protein
MFRVGHTGGISLGKPTIANSGYDSLIFDTKI